MRNISLIFRRVVKSVALVAVLSMTTLFAQAQDIKAGESLFQTNCTMCHGIDNAVIGPALKGVSDNFEHDWLVSWIKNSPALIASGDPQAVEVSELHPSAMPAFPLLSDDDVNNIIAYIADASVAKPAADGAGADGTAGAAGGSGQSGDVSNFMFGGLILVLIIAFLVILVLNRVIRTLDRIILRNKDSIVEQVEEEGESSGQALVGKLKKLSKNKKLVFFVILGLVAILSSAGWNVMWNTGVHEGYQPVQPIKFSHQLHAGINQIDCQYCHSGAATSRDASIPSPNVCMNCHNYVTASEKYGGEVSPEIQKIYNAIDWDPETRTYGDNPKPIEWIRIHNLPDLAYFNHSQHVTVAGIECQKCHGPIETMEEVYQYSPLTMKWCIECHQETEVNAQGNAYYDQLIAAHEKLKSGEKITAAVLGGLECGKCHY